MSHSRRKVRGRPRSNPRGMLQVRGGGYGFVRTAEGEFFVPEAKMNGAFDGDYVEIVPLPNNEKRKGRPMKNGPFASEMPAARIVRIVDRAHDTLVGRYEVAEPFGIVVPEDTRIPYDIFTQRNEYPDIPDGALVRVRISTFPSRHSSATGVIEEVLGMADDDDMSVELVIARHKLETKFSEEAVRQSEEAQLDAVGALAAGYRDITDRFVFTIDPVDARDFDDALSLDYVDNVNVKGKKGSVWRLGVHIADVSHYVPWGSSLDLDARRRATSTYLVDRVIPMLPEGLSNELCSLKPCETRRSVTVDLYLNEHAQLVDSDIYFSLIESNMRLAYDDAQFVLDSVGSFNGEKDPVPVLPYAGNVSPSVLEDLCWRICQASRLAKKRCRTRIANGGLEFSTTEAKMLLDADGVPIDIVLRKKTDATELIEEAMIFANETVAKTLHAASFPNVYRVHEKPFEDSLAGLVAVFQEFSWFSEIDKGRLLSGDPFTLQKILRIAKGRLEGDLVTSLVLRSMKRALYKPDCEGHYGLALSAYSHFTSPIRRYPDLITHRMLRAFLTKRPEKFDQEVSALSWLCEHSSAMERVAEKASRESQEMKMIEYLGRFVGQSFSAVVSGVASYGLYVRLDNTAEGLVHVRELGREYFIHDAVRHCLRGSDTGVSYRLGQRLNVVLASADPRSRRLDFKLASSGATTEQCYYGSLGPMRTVPPAKPRRRSDAVSKGESDYRKGKSSKGSASHGKSRNARSGKEGNRRRRSRSSGLSPRVASVDKQPNKGHKKKRR